MFLGFLFLPATIVSVCDDPERISNSPNRYTITSNRLVMIDCVFENLSGENGGAVSCSATEQDVSFNRSSFLSSSGTTSVGGFDLVCSECLISSYCIQEG
jgi:hypothetical protein